MKRKKLRTQVSLTEDTVLYFGTKKELDSDEIKMKMKVKKCLETNVKAAETTRQVLTEKSSQGAKAVRKELERRNVILESYSRVETLEDIRDGLKSFEEGNKLGETVVSSPLFGTLPTEEECTHMLRACDGRALDFFNVSVGAISWSLKSLSKNHMFFDFDGRGRGGSVDTEMPSPKESSYGIDLSGGPFLISKKTPTGTNVKGKKMKTTKLRVVKEVICQVMSFK